MKLQRISFIIVIVAVIGMSLNSFMINSEIEVSAEGGVNWITDFADLEAKMKTEPRPIMYDIHTTWCGPCQQMKKKVFTNEKVIKYLNENYYAVYLDAERQDQVTFRGKTHEIIRTRRGYYNKIADYVTNNQTEAYPTIAIMNRDYKVKYAEAGYHTVSNLMYVLKKNNK